MLRSIWGGRRGGAAATSPDRGGTPGPEPEGKNPLEVALHKSGHA